MREAKPHNCYLSLISDCVPPTTPRFLLSPHLLQPFLLQNVGDNDVNLKRTVDEIKKLQEEVSALRQENIQLKVRKREREG